MVAYDRHPMVSRKDVAGVVIAIVERVEQGFDFLHDGVYHSDVVHVFLITGKNMLEISRMRIPWSVVGMNAQSYPSLRDEERRQRLRNVVVRKDEHLS